MRQTDRAPSDLLERPPDATASNATPSGWFGNDHPSLRRAWHPVARSIDVTDSPHGVELLGEQLVLARLDGTLTAFQDRCPHRLAPLSAGTIIGGQLQCAYHGYRFAVDGRCVAVPALGESAIVPPKAHIEPLRVREHQGMIWLALDEPITELLAVDEHDDASFVTVPLAPSDWTAGAAQMVDNFLDVAHFPFTHLGTFGDPDDTTVEDYRVEREDEWGFHVEHRHLAKAISGSGELVHRVQSFTHRAPLTVVLRITYVEEGVTLTISFHHQPLGPGRTRLWVTDYRNDIDVDGIDGAAAFQMAVGNEDKALLERFHVKSIPLTPSAEVHTRADRITLEYRRMLGDFVEAAREPSSRPAPQPADRRAHQPADRPAHQPAGRPVEVQHG